MYGYIGGLGMMIFGFGFLGSIIDSYYGSLLQAKYRIPSSSEIVEDRNGNQKASFVGGFVWMNNDAVNSLTLLSIAIIGLFFLMR